MKKGRMRPVWLFIQLAVVPLRQTLDVWSVPPEALKESHIWF
jgi:hypothetical protein